MDELEEFRRWMWSAHHQLPIRGGNGRWMYRCPAHEDDRHSLSVRIGRNGKLDLHCFAGCSRERVLQALGWPQRARVSLLAPARAVDQPPAPDLPLGRRLLLRAWRETARCPLTDEARSYLRRRRIPYRAALLRSSEQVWEALLQQASPPQLVKAGLARNGGKDGLVPPGALRPLRVLIPYFRDGRLTHLRSRSLVDSDPIRYCGLPGWGSDVYIADAPAGSTVFVLEGEFKAILLRHYGGYPCVALAGVHTAHAKLVELCRQRQLQPVILFDTEPDKPSVARAAWQLHRVLTDAQVPAAVAWLRDPRYGSGRIAPDDYLLDCGLFQFQFALHVEYTAPKLDS